MYGWAYTPANVILNDSFKLDMPRMIMYDWAHIYMYMMALLMSSSVFA